MPQDKEQRRQAARDGMRRLRDVRRGLVTMEGKHVLPRELRVLTGLAAGLTKQEALTAAGFKSNGSVADRLLPGQDLAEVLKQVCIAQGLTVDVPVKVAVENVQAVKETWMPHGLHSQPDAQARIAAARLAREIQADAGMIPAGQVNPGTTITVNIIKFGEMRSIPALASDEQEVITQAIEASLEEHRESGETR